jgi:MoxR-like ATPase
MSSTIESGQLGQAAQICTSITAEVGRVFLGAAWMTETLLTALIARGHVLVEGFPGVAKTTLVKAFAGTIGCQFRRIQFTPDLLPSDITGTNILDMRSNTFVLRQGPVFTNLLLGDEINRAPAKTQSALLEAMAERQVTIEGETQMLAEPFMVLATQNPIEQEGTYPLPEAQVDRFLIKMKIGYPSAVDEKRMLATYDTAPAPANRLISAADVVALQTLAERVFVAEELVDYILGLVQYTRSHSKVALGASPRAALALLHSCKAFALIKGRDYALPDDIRYLAPMVLGHRLLIVPEAEIDGTTGPSVIAESLEKTPFKMPKR